jgi:hypothetical protein
MKHSEMINELFSRRKADLDEIVNGEANPSKDEILNSKDFQVNLVNDLINKKANVNSWEVRQSNGSLNDLESTEDDKFPVDFDFDFVYNFHGIPVSLTLFINGEVDVNWNGSHRSATHWQPAEHPEPEIDQRSFGRDLDLALYDDDGSEISLTWLSPELQTKVVKSIIAPYL